MRDAPTEPMMRAAPAARAAYDEQERRRFARFGREAYEAWRGATEDGKQRPPWESLADRAQEAWVAAARAVVVELSR